MNPAATHFLQTLAAHSALAGLVLFLAAALEALVVVGAFIPGDLIIFSGGTLAGAGVLNPWMMLACVFAGAVAGDGFSYWLGYRYRERILHFWPFSRHPGFLAQGRDFFARQGGRSVLIARFLAPVRAIVPVTAGVAGMLPVRFFSLSVPSAAVWAPVHLLPGIVFGASLQLAAAVTARLVTLLLVLAALFWLGKWLVRLLLARAAPFIGRGRARLLAWGTMKGGAVARFVVPILDPDRPGTRRLQFLAGLFVVSMALFLAVLESVATLDPLVHADRAAFHFLQDQRTPWMDQLMVAVTMTGDGFTLVPVVITVALWLILRREWRPLGYWISALGFSALAGVGLKLWLGRPRPMDLYTGWSSYAFPSAHALAGAAVYGLLAFLLAWGRSVRGQYTAVLPLTLLILLIAFSRVYLGAHWLSDSLGGVFLGAAWAALLSIAYAWRGGQKLPGGQLALVAGVVFAAAMAWQIGSRFPMELARYSPRQPVRMMREAQWIDNGWQRLPFWRSDVSGRDKEALSIQWAAGLDEVRRQLSDAGWRTPVPWRWRSAFLLLAPPADILAYPVPPRLNGGADTELVMVRAEGAGQRWVIRLWPTPWRVLPANGGKALPLWTGSLSAERRHPVAYFLTLVRSDPYRAPSGASLTGLLRTCPGSACVFRQGGGVPGPVLLIRGRAF